MWILLLAFLAVGGGADIASWVEAQGGRVVRDGARITGVDLHGSWVTDGDLAVLERLPQLRTLDLSYTHVSDLGLERLRPLKGVTDLNLRYAEHVTDEGLAHLKGWKKLEKIDVTGTKITDTAERQALSTRRR